MSKEHEENAPRKRGDRWLLCIVLILFLAGLGIRGYGYLSRTDGHQKVYRSYDQKGLPTTLREGEKRAIQPENDEIFGESNLLMAIAPYLTEGGLSFLLGFCIGYFLRVVAKTVIFLVGGLYICLILLSHYGMITVDWGNFQQILQQVLLNTTTQVEGLHSALTVGLPSVAMGVLGIWRGLKKAK